MIVEVEVWSDIVCPWCFVGKRRLEAALAEFEHADDVEVVFRSFELDPTAPQHGHELTAVSLARKLGRTEDETRDMQQQLIDLAASEGLEMRLHDTVHTNTVDAHRLLHLARDIGGTALQRRLAEALFAAYFTRAEDVGDLDVLTKAAVGVGLDEARVREVLGSQEYAEAFEADVAQARAYGATGVPFFVVDRKYGVSGAQPVEVFSRLLDQAWSESHPTLQTVGGDADGACGPDGCAI